MKRRMKVSVELLADLCSACSHPKGERYFEVTDDPIPENHKVVGVVYDHQSQRFEIVIESPDFIDDGRTYISPCLALVKQ